MGQQRFGKRSHGAQLAQAPRAVRHRPAPGILRGVTQDRVEPPEVPAPGGGDRDPPRLRVGSPLRQPIGGDRQPFQRQAGQPVRGGIRQRFAQHRHDVARKRLKVDLGEQQPRWSVTGMCWITGDLDQPPPHPLQRCPSRGSHDRRDCGRLVRVVQQVDQPVAQQLPHLGGEWQSGRGLDGGPPQLGQVGVARQHREHRHTLVAEY